MESGGNAELCAYQENISGQTRISIHDCPLSKSTCKLLNRVVPNGTLRGVEGESKISPIRLFCFYPDAVEQIIVGARLHDIGKLMILYATIMSGGTGGDIRTV